jgi:hypothetical protein
MSTQVRSTLAGPKPSSPSPRVAAPPRGGRAPTSPTYRPPAQAGSVPSSEPSDFVVDWQLGPSDVSGG